MHVGSTRGSRSASGQPLETCWLHFGVHFGLQRHILEPFGSHFGSILELPDPFWVHFGARLGLQEHIWAADPILGPILEPFWVHFGAQFGPKKQPKNRTKIKTISDTILGPNLEPFWDQIWTNLDVIWELC